MKKTILAVTLVAGVLLSACSTPSEKVVKANENVTEASQDLEKANKEYLADIDACKKQTNERIAANEKSTAEFNTRIEHEKKAAQIEYRKKISELEKKNSDMKKKMDDYKADGKENWEKFKTSFNTEMDALNIAFDDLTTKKTK